jgi:hypothetical protein
MPLAKKVLRDLLDFACMWEEGGEGSWRKR